jgi:hypothetical protein
VATGIQRVEQAPSLIPHVSRSMPPMISSAMEPGTPTIVLLGHFMHDLNKALGVPLPDDVWELAHNNEHLLNSILAVSASHLRHCASNPNPHQIAEHYQQSCALTRFRSELSRPLTKCNSDALLITAILLNLLNFAFIEDKDPFTSWVFDPSPDRLWWLGIQLGLKPLLIATRPFRGDSLLEPIYDAGDDVINTYSRCDLGLEGVPEGWVRLISVSDAKYFPESNHINILHEPIRILAHVRNVEPKEWTLYQYLQFIGKIDTPFLQLLYERDERALWSFGYWLALMSRFDEWWCTPRVQRDYTAIRIWLDISCARDRPGDEGSLWGELLDELDAVWETGTQANTKIGSR